MLPPDPQMMVVCIRGDHRSRGSPHVHESVPMWAHSGLWKEIQIQIQTQMGGYTNKNQITGAFQQ